MAGEAGAREAERLSVLIVDDNRDLADSLSMLMRLWGYDVCVAYNGAEGLRTARHQRPDCLLLDISMPGMDGYMLARLLRQEPGLEKAKLVAHTAYSSDDHVRKMGEAGFDYRLTKPAAPAELEGLLRMMDHIKKLAEQTEELARRNVELAGDTKDLINEVKEDIKEVKQDIKEMKETLEGALEKAESPEDDTPGE